MEALLISRHPLKFLLYLHNLFMISALQCVCAYGYMKIFMTLIMAVYPRCRLIASVASWDRKMGNGRRVFNRYIGEDCGGRLDSVIQRRGSLKYDQLGFEAL